VPLLSLGSFRDEFSLPLMLKSMLLSMVRAVGSERDNVLLSLLLMLLAIFEGLNLDEFLVVIGEVEDVDPSELCLVLFSPLVRSCLLELGDSLYTSCVSSPMYLALNLGLVCIACYSVLCYDVMLLY
jgi:hypothetical protein